MWRRAVLGVFLGVVAGAALALWATGSPGYLVTLILVPSLGLPLLIAVLVVVGTRRAGTPADPGPPERLTVWLRRGVVIVTALAAATLVVLPVGDLVGRGLRDVGTGDFGAEETVTGRYQQETVDALAEVVGGYQFTSVGFYDGYVIVTAPTTPGARTTDTFSYRWGSASRDGAESIQPSSADELREELFDASRIDFAKVPALAEQARTLSGIAEPTSTYVHVRRQSVRVAGENVDMVVFTVSLRDDYWTGTVTSRVDGSVVSTSGSAFTR